MATDSVANNSTIDTLAGDLAGGADALLNGLAALDRAAQDTRALIEELRAQRDELLAALRNLVDAIESGVDQREINFSIKEAHRALAIAKAEGSR